MLEVSIKKIAIGAVTLIILLTILIQRPWVTVKSTERGIVYRWWAVTESLWEWLHMILPFADSVKKVAIVPTTLDISIPVDSQGSITKDNQTIGSSITVFYRFESSKLLDIAKNYWFEVLVNKIIKDTTESFKQVIWGYTIFDVAQKQEEIRQLVKKAVVQKIGEYPIMIDDIKVSNYDRSEAFDAQIAKTMEMAQEAKQSEQALKKIEIDAQKRVKEAEANKQAEALNADAMKLKGEGIAEYNAAITSNPKNMELELKLKELEIEKIKAEKWNWQYVPTNNYWPIPVSYSPVNLWQ